MCRWHHCKGLQRGCWETRRSDVFEMFLLTWCKPPHAAPVPCRVPAFHFERYQTRFVQGVFEFVCKYGLYIGDCCLSSQHCVVWGCCSRRDFSNPSFSNWITDMDMFSILLKWFPWPLYIVAEAVFQLHETVAICLFHTRTAQPLLC